MLALYGFWRFERWTINPVCHFIKKPGPPGDRGAVLVSVVGYRACWCWPASLAALCFAACTRLRCDARR
jgi:hypothetical protein